MRFLYIFALGLLSLAVHAQGKMRATIVALGASNTEGYGVATWESYPSQLEALLKAKGIDAVVVNAGISGDTTGGMLARLDKDVSSDANLVILQPGTNDARYGSFAERETNIGKIKSRLAERGVKLIIIENSKLAELPNNEMQEDGIHYTAKGYRILAERLLPEVLAAMSR